MNHLISVIPAFAGIQALPHLHLWIPACAGMTILAVGFLFS